MSVFVGLGSNVGNGPALIEAALQRLGLRDGIRVTRVSPLYRTEPWGMKAQPDFVNAVAELETALEPEALLERLLETEMALGRSRRGPRWGPRSIDLDLLVYGDRVVATPQLQLPHPRMYERAFVLVPLLDLEPDFSIPGVGCARECLVALGDQRVQRLDCG